MIALDYELDTLEPGRRVRRPRAGGDQRLGARPRRRAHARRARRHAPRSGERRRGAATTPSSSARIDAMRSRRHVAAGDRGRAQRGGRPDPARRHAAGGRRASRRRRATSARRRRRAASTCRGWTESGMRELGLGEQRAQVAGERARVERLERDAEPLLAALVDQHHVRRVLEVPARDVPGPAAVGEVGRRPGRRRRRPGAGSVGCGGGLVLERVAAGVRVGGAGTRPPAAAAASASCASRVDRRDPVVDPDGPQLVARAEQVAPAAGRARAARASRAPAAACRRPGRR